MVSVGGDPLRMNRHGARRGPGEPNANVATHSPLLIYQNPAAWCAWRFRCHSDTGATLFCCQSAGDRRFNEGVVAEEKRPRRSIVVIFLFLVSR